MPRSRKPDRAPAAQDPAAARSPGRAVVYDNRWMRVVSEQVRLRPGAAPEEYYVVEVPDWAVICPRTPDGRFILVEQYRPAVDRLVLEFPAGEIDPGETAAAAIERELFEETGHRPVRLMPLGNYFVDTGRLSNRAHLFFGQVEAAAGWTPEPGLVVRFVAPAEIDRMVADGRLGGLHHVALWLLVKANEAFG